ncbi:MAG: DISARM system phospholipase D-like protein DrmC [Actinomycetota bacterium]|nr:DISARM system phospholipase D-like protein DrmC [Actinomycetota bacterium]
MIDPLLELPGHLRRRLSEALAAGTLGPPYSTVAVRSALGTATEEADVLCGVLVELNHAGIPPLGVVLALQAADKAREEVTRPDLVWSGPEVPGLHARDTRRVYEELIGGAERSIWASTYAYFDGPKAFRIMAERMDAKPGLSVKLLLNITRKWGDTTASENLVNQFAEQFWTKDWPGQRRPDAYYFPPSLSQDAATGVLHAKGVVVDDAFVFVTSANFTEAALDRNIEVGVLSRDHTLAASLATHFRVLIEQELLQPLPVSHQR